MTTPKKYYTLIAVIVVLVVLMICKDSTSTLPREEIEEGLNEELKRVTGDSHADLHNIRSRITTDDFIAEKHSNVMKTPEKALDEIHRDTCKVNECK